MLAFDIHPLLSCFGYPLYGALSGEKYVVGARLHIQAPTYSVLLKRGRAIATKLNAKPYAPVRLYGGTTPLHMVLWCRSIDIGELSQDRNPKRNSC